MNPLILTLINVVKHKAPVLLELARFVDEIVKLVVMVNVVSFDWCAHNTNGMAHPLPQVTVWFGDWVDLLLLLLLTLRFV